MSVQYAVQANVFDIGEAGHRTTDCFLIDSNVLLWMTYSNAGHGEPNWRSALMGQYATFVQGAISANARLCCCGLSLSELSHIIEKTEREIHGQSFANNITSKEYRHNFSAQRTHVVNEIQAAWSQVSSIADPIPATIDGPALAAALARLKSEKVDGYDLFILEAMKNNKVVQIITDDGDFTTIPGIQVFTANRSAIRSARAQKKLLTR